MIDSFIRNNHFENLNKKVKYMYDAKQIFSYFAIVSALKINLNKKTHKLIDFKES